jgi:hypothetical protein
LERAMSWSPGEGVEVSVGLSVGSRERVDLSVNRATHVGYLTIGTIAEIKLEASHLETLRDQLPGVLADLAVLDAARNRAADTASRTMELENYLHDEAAVADRAGDREAARSLRAAGDTLTAARSALDSVLEAVDSAARVADDACEDARTLLGRHR